MHESKWSGGVRKGLIRALNLGVGASLIALGCSDVADRGTSETSEQDSEALETKGEVTPVERLPQIEPMAAAETFVQLLPKPTAQGENVAVHVKLPPPTNGRLKGSLVRILGGPENPLVLFSSDALAKLGQIRSSPGADFFTAFLTLEESEIERRLEIEKELGSSDDASRTTIVFRGRTPIGVTSGIHFDHDRFRGGGLVALGICPLKPASTLARWQESLMITDPAVVRNLSRTRDTCRGPLLAGNPNGVWTFKHLMSQMAVGSGLTAHDFVLGWLRRWLNPYTVNSDTVPARTQMFNQVIQPWATASGVTATLTTIGGFNLLSLSGPLNLDRAPFRLSAIVNRIDLGGTTSGPGGYGGGITSQPTDAGELRFVFGVQNLTSCNVLPFSVILEYGVPIRGCSAVRNWAVKWTKLNNPAFAPRFSAAWLAHLESLTQSVVLNGAAPGKGNQNAINQIRTNEIALAAPWELREFKLAIENTMTDTDTPANGPLRPHTVAQTPNDSVFSPTPHPTVDAFVLSQVVPSVPNPLPILPDGCRSNYQVPGVFLGQPFKGGNALTLPPTHWEANVNPADNRHLCARHEFSKNTCNGCHFGDTSTPFLHVNPQAMPATLSNFLTGAGGVWTVPDTQFGAPNWEFADLERRYQRLYQIACTQCGIRPPFIRDFLEVIFELNGGVPIDPIGPVIDEKFRVGPVTDIQIVQKLFERRDEFVSMKLAEDVDLDGSIRPAETFVH